MSLQNNLWTHTAISVYGFHPKKKKAFCVIKFKQQAHKLFRHRDSSLGRDILQFIQEA